VKGNVSMLDGVMVILERTIVFTVLLCLCYKMSQNVVQTCSKIDAILSLSQIASWGIQIGCPT
jgi:hypothetical protein